LFAPLLVLGEFLTPVPPLAGVLTTSSEMALLGLGFRLPSFRGYSIPFSPELRQVLLPWTVRVGSVRECRSLSRFTCGCSPTFRLLSLPRSVAITECTLAHSVLEPVWGALVQAHVGPVCHALQHSTSVVFCSPPERSSVGRGLLLPPSSRAQEGRGSLSQNDPLGSLVDLLAWVLRPDPACSGRSSKFRPGSQGAGSAPVRNSSRESRRAVADGMALVHGSRRLSVRLRSLLLSAGCA